MYLARLSIIAALVSGFPALAHEFWIEPEQYQVENGQEVVANLKNGEEFEGVSLAWFDNRFTRFEMTLGNDVRPVEGRLGDTPALRAEAFGKGLMVITHETMPSSLTYTEWDKFLAFAEHKDFTSAQSDHLANGWSTERFRETYTRHAKALIAVGDGAGSDRAVGLETEIVALSNPYAADFDGTMRVLVNYQDAPRADAQVEVFERTADGMVAVTLHRTDAEGIAEVAVNAGSEYLFDAVVLRPAPDAGSAENAPVWETLWAALTFKVP